MANGTSDPLVVSGEDLKKALMPLMQEQDRIREDHLNGSYYGDKGHTQSNSPRATDVPKRIEPYGGTRWIAEQVGIDASGVTQTLGREWVTFRVAEKWLLALGLQHLLDNGTIRVVANPRWSQERWYNYMKERGCV